MVDELNHEMVLQVKTVILIKWQKYVLTSSTSMYFVSFELLSVL